jgi:hypothetical protein
MYAHHIFPLFTALINIGETSQRSASSDSDSIYDGTYLADDSESFHSTSNHSYNLLER